MTSLDMTSLAMTSLASHNSSRFHQFQRNEMPSISTFQLYRKNDGITSLCLTYFLNKLTSVRPFFTELKLETVSRGICNPIAPRTSKKPRIFFVSTGHGLTWNRVGYSFCPKDLQHPILGRMLSFDVSFPLVYPIHSEPSTCLTWTWFRCS